MKRFFYMTGPDMKNPPASPPRRFFVLLFFFNITALIPVFPQDNTTRILNLLEDMLNTAAESTKPLPPQGANPSFYLTNKTGFILKEVYVTREEPGDWGANLFTGSLYNGQTVLITLKSPINAGEAYNIRVVDIDGDRYSKYGVQIAASGVVEITIGELDQ